MSLPISAMSTTENNSNIVKNPRKLIMSTPEDSMTAALNSLSYIAKKNDLVAPRLKHNQHYIKTIVGIRFVTFNNPDGSYPICYQAYGTEVMKPYSTNGSDL